MLIGQFKSKLILISSLILSLHCLNLSAQTAAKYSLNILNGTYTSISSSGMFQPEVVFNDSSADITLNPGFSINGTIYSHAIMHNNGYLILHSGTLAKPNAIYITDIFSSYSLPIISPFFTDLRNSGFATTSAFTQTIGSVHLFEWKNFTRNGNGDDLINFQVSLNSSNGEIKFMYGSCIPGSGLNRPIVGWKSTGIAWSTDANVLMQNEFGSSPSCSWNFAVNSYNYGFFPPSMYFNAANPLIKPNTGLTYSWTPQNLVSPVRVFSAVTNITGSGATLSWTAPPGATQYNVQYRVAGTSCSWTDWPGNPISANTITLSGLLQNTNYQIRVQAIQGTNQTIYSHIPVQTVASGAASNGYTANGTFKTLTLPCAGVPNPGYTTATNLLPCPGSQVTFSLQYAAILGTGVTYQWYDNGISITGATNASYTKTIISSESLYCDVTCSGSTGSSIPVTVNLNNPYNCTCSSTALSTDQEDIYQVSLGGMTVNATYLNGNGCINTAPGPGSVLHKYSNFKSLGSLSSFTQGDQVPFEIRINECTGAPYHANGVGIWIDFNQNGLFTDPGETIFTEPTTTACSGNSPSGDKVVSGTLSIPFNALTGQTAVRVICADGIAGSGLMPCLNYSYGETEDMLITILAALPCSGAPNPGNTIASTQLACNGSTVLFTLQNQPSVTGLTYQWYNTTGLISGATQSSYTQVMNHNDSVFCAVACNSGPHVFSTPVNVQMDTFLNCYCLPGSQFGTVSGYYGWISNVSFGTITNNSSFPNGSNTSYTFYNPTANTQTSVLAGSIYPLSVIINSGYSQAAAWFDWNQNGVFDTTEFIMLGSNSSSAFPVMFSQAISVPSTVLDGSIRMRIRSQHYGFGLSAADACSMLVYGETEDYIIHLQSGIGCAGTPSPGMTIASASSACYGTLVQFSLQNQLTGTNVVYQWYNDSGPVSGTNSPYYTQTITASDHIYCEVKCGTSTISAGSVPVYITLDTSANCTCIPNSQFGTAFGSVGWIGAVDFGLLANVSSFPATAPYYTDFGSVLQANSSFTAGLDYLLSVTINSSHSQVAAWFDWNQDGQFDSSEYTFLGINNSVASLVSFTQLISIPWYIQAGSYKMRIRSQQDSLMLTPNDACTLLSYGETEDYSINIDLPPACPTSMGGYFTINQTIPSGGNNFSSFTEFATYLTCGISSPVVVSVVPGTGPYDEQVILGEISGASSINTITVLGNNEELTNSITSQNAPYTLMLSGADFIHFKDLKITGTSTIYANACQLTNAADHNWFTNCLFTVPPNTTNPYQIPFSIFPSNGNSGNDNILNACTTNNGYRAILLRGSPSIPAWGNKIINCHIEDAGLLGIGMTYQQGAEVSGNTIQRLNRFLISNFTACTIDTGCTSTQVNMNKIRNLFEACPACSGSTSMTGIQVSAVTTMGNENLVYNNLISDIRKATGSLCGIGISSGVYHVKIYHNTISLDDTLTGGNSQATCGIICNNNVTGVDIRNNLIYIRKAGLASKYCLSIQSPTGVTCNNNNLFVSSIAGQSYIGGFMTLSYVTLSAWKLANASSYDQESVSADPGFLNPLAYDYHPQNSLCDNIGTFVGIPSDIVNTPRSINQPDAGCYEFTVYPLDLGIRRFIHPDSTGCYNSSVPVVVTIKNNGFSTINFSLNPATLSCQVDGVISTTLSTSISSGFLNPGDTLDVALPTCNMTVLGTYLFNPNISLVGDTNFLNNTLAVPIIRTVQPIAGTISSIPSSACIASLVQLLVQGNYGGSIQWQQSTGNSSGPWMNIGSGASMYTPSTPITQSTWYRVIVTCNGMSDSTSPYLFQVYNPIVLSTVSGSRCGIGQVALSATGSPNSILNWYNSLTDQIPVNSGNSYTTPVISSTTDYYVAAAEGPPPSSFNLSTTSMSNNASSGVLFDVNILNPIRIDYFSTKMSSPGGTVQIYYRSGTGTGFTNSISGWTLLGSGNVNTTTNAVGIIPVNVNLVLQPGVYSFALKCTTGMEYLNGDALGQVFASDSNVQIKQGYGSSSSVFFAFSHSPVKWCGMIQYTTIGCESPRTAVTAVINPPPAVNMNIGSSTICPGGSTSIGVSSSANPNYTYSWASNPPGFTAIGTGPFFVNPVITTSYTVTATDNSTGPYGGCANQASTTIITGSTLTPGTVSASGYLFCNSGSPVLTLTGASGGSIQWQSSTTSTTGPWNNIGAGLNAYTPTTPITQTTWYRALVTCQTNSLPSNVIQVIVNHPPAVITGSTSGSACGVGSTVQLHATSNPGSNPHWYDSPTGGLLLDTGNNFTTPPLTATKTYYVSALPGLGGVAHAVMPPEDAVMPANVNTVGYWFTAPVSFTIQGVRVPSSGNLVGTLQSIAIVKFNGSLPIPSISGGGTTNYTTLFLTQNNTDTGSIACNVTISSGDIIGILGQRSSINSLSAFTAGNPVPVAINGSPVGFYPLATYNGIASGSLSTIGDLSSASNARLGRVEFSYILGGGCDEIRSAVTATILQSPPVTVSSSSTVLCHGDSATLSVTSSNDPNYTYTWYPGAYAGNIHTVSPSTTTVYSVFAQDNSSGMYTGCLSQGTTTINVNPSPTITGINVSNALICQGESTSLSVDTPIVSSYCSAGAINTCAVLPTFYISNVSLGSINNNSTCSGVNNYSDFTSVSTTLSAGSTYPMSVSIAVPSAWTELLVWVDYDHDGQFSNLNEQTVLLPSSIVNGSVPTAISYISVPPNALNGPTRMRIRLNNPGNPVGGALGAWNDACGYANFGEVEDYTLNIIGGMNSPYSWSPASFLLYGTGSTVNTIGLNSNTTYTVTATNSFGCTHTATQSILVKPVTNSTTSVTTCTPSYLWNGNTYSIGGLYTTTFVNFVGCDSLASLNLTIIPCNSILHLTCFIQGYWNGTGMNAVLFNEGEPTTPGACDSILVELHEMNPPYSLAHSVKAVLNQNGNVTAIFPLLSGAFYIAVKHRSALTTWSSTPVSMGLGSSVYNFSSAASGAFGNNQKELSPGIWGFYNGELSNDDNIDLVDLAIFEIDLYNFQYGYFPTDLNGDGNVDLLDIPILEENINAFIYSVHP